MCSRKWLIVALVACALASACSQYNTNLSIQTSSSVLTFVSPSAASVGGQGFTITANGAGFTAGSLILWNGTALTTTLVSNVQLTAPVPASDLATAGTVQVAVQIPGSATSPTSNVNSTTTTEISNVVLFTIGAAPGTPPAIASLSASATSPTSTPYCSTQGFLLTVNGTNFTSDALVNWNGVAISKSATTFASATTFVSATQLTASVPAADTALAGTANVSVSNSLGTSNSLPLTLSTPAGGFSAPTISSVSPITIGAGSSPLAITVQGNVLPCTAVQWVDSNNVTTTLPTTYVPAVAPTLTSPAIPAALVATVPAADLANPGTTHIQLVNPGTTASSQLPFTIAAPTVTSLSSSITSLPSTPACSPPGVILTVTGTNFVNGSVVEWTVPATQSALATTSALVTTFVSSTQLTAAIPASDIAFANASPISITVSNSGFLSNPSPFTISTSSPPTPTNVSISHTRATAGAAAFSLTVNGTNLLPCSVVQWTNGSVTTDLATTYFGPTQLNPAQLIATVPAADIASVGTAQVAVASPASSANPSTPISFQIVLPTITSLSASTTSANNTPYCSPTGLTLTVNGTDFEDGLVINWNGSPRPTTLVSATQLTAAITATDTAFLGTGAAAVAIAVSGSSPATNSNSLKFSVTALPTGTTLPAPVINSISPTNAAVETLTGPPVALIVIGSGLSPCSVVQWNGNTLATNIFVGINGIAAVIPAANITAAGMDQVTVNTPTPGGGTSGNEAFTVYTPGSPISTRIAGGSLSLPLMSSSQRYAVYVLASTLGTTEIPGTTQNIFVDDTCLGVTTGCTPSMTLVSAATNGNPGNADSIAPSINADSAVGSADGRYVSFLSSATNLVTGVTNGLMNAYVRDTCAGVSSGCTPSTQLVSVTTGGTQANGATTSATIDKTGRYITFQSEATNLGSISSSGGIFLRDICAGVASGCTPSTQPLD
jgi:hypothetical protein